MLLPNSTAPMSHTPWATIRLRIIAVAIGVLILTAALDKAFGQGTSRKLLAPLLPISLAIAFWNYDKPWARRFLDRPKSWWQ